ncbi:MAG TPA: SagB/ThcOx family dehydrogenase [Leptolyngbyaceae cyanobacterium M33_DOE_097]|nr:SagB/ThcOx family dehydrogenase [Leptolyngbyaceae cyanobacterium M33_DOE_097]
MPNSSTSLAEQFHQHTKYDPHTIHTKSQSLDWDRQPTPYKEYPIGKVVDLKPFIEKGAPIALEDAEAQWWQRLSQMLYCSYGVTGMISTVSKPHYLRSAPSAGGLYPAEIYLVSRGDRYFAPGLYNYQVKDHSLVQFWESPSWEKLEAACFGHPALAQARLAIIVTGVFWRSAWRYQDRAYRRILLDSGHLLGNVELACAISGFRPCLVGGFADAVVNELLYINEAEEGAIAVIPLLDWLEQTEIVDTGCVLPMPSQKEAATVTDGEFLGYFHQATQMPATPQTAWRASTTRLNKTSKYNFPFCFKVDATTAPVNWGDRLSGLPETMLKRRSTREYNGASLTIEELKALLDFTYQPHHYANQGLDDQPDFFTLNLVETFIAVSAVTGLEDGCYYYAPAEQELRQIRFKNFRRELHFLCLGQNLGRDAAVVLFQTADLKTAVEQYGDRVYRYLHMDAGHLGQRLNLAAIHLGLGVSGIGGFFDDQVNEVLGIPPEEAVLYITTLGRAR